MKRKFNVLEHDLVPQHIILSEKEGKKVLEDYGIQAEQLPKILNIDPAAVAIGAKPGQIIKIIRKSPTAEQAISYRRVIESEDSKEERE